MTAAEALAEIKRLAGLDRIAFTRHARERMLQRAATARDVKNAALSATGAMWQADRDNWRVVGGVDLDGDGLVLVVDIEADLIIVTVF